VSVATFPDHSSEIHPPFCLKEVKHFPEIMNANQSGGDGRQTSSKSVDLRFGYEKGSREAAAAATTAGNCTGCMLQKETNQSPACHSYCSAFFPLLIRVVLLGRRKSETEWKENNERNKQVDHRFLLSLVVPSLRSSCNFYHTDKSFFFSSAAAPPPVSSNQQQNNNAAKPVSAYVRLKRWYQHKQRLREMKKNCKAGIKKNTGCKKRETH
jgi:hypothetical protein